MKKLLISLLVPVVFAASCGQNGTVSSPDPAGYSPEAVLYNDWDRAVRIDVDMQNMYVSTPTKIEKPIDLYMSMALALKYNYTRRLITYEDSIIRAGPFAGQPPAGNRQPRRLHQRHQLQHESGSESGLEHA